MPTNIYTPEFPSVTGVLDEEALVVGHFADAHVLRSIGNASNRLAGRGNYLVHEVFRRAGNDEQIGTTGFYMTAQWQRLRSFPLLERKAHLNRADLRIRARITNGATVVLQAETAALRHRPEIRQAGANTMLAVGTGGFELYEMQIELGRASVEDVTIYALGDAVTAPLMPSAVYGAPNTGNVNDPDTYLFEDGLQRWPTGTWNSQIRPDRIVVTFADASGNLLLAPLRVGWTFQNILRWGGFIGGVSLTSDETQLLRDYNAAYSLRAVPTVRLSSITIRERDAYAT
jgi:hypothetical protein